jgi:hypothetical protein
MKGYLDEHPAIRGRRRRKRAIKFPRNSVGTSERIEIAPKSADPEAGIEVEMDY